MKQKKYLLLGDHIRSASDGDRHFIDAHNLCRLYDLNPEECVFSIAGREGERSRRGIPEGLLILRPRHRGDYQEHLAERLREEVSK